jgi:hypothetical protein
MRGPGPTLLTQHRNYIRNRAVADDVAVKRGYQSAIGRTDLERLGFGRTQQLVPALVIPIHSVRPEVESYQLRPDTPRLNEKGRPRKFEMKAGARMLMDSHPRLTRPSEAGGVALIADPQVPLVLTEGILKADSAISIGLPCIALLGVWNWRGSNEAGGKVALPDFEWVALDGRVLYIAFDSDAMEKREIHSALVRLKLFLESRKAIVRLIYLPPCERGEKNGLDDHIAHAKAIGKRDEIRDALLALASSELRKPTTSGCEKQVGIYCEKPGGLVRVSISPQGVELEYPLTNFTARIVGDITRDDGAETTRSFEIALTQGERAVTTTVAIAQFPTMRWPVEALGAEAVLYAGAGTADHARAAIQLLSGSPARRTVFTHSGWHKFDDD